MQGSQHVLRLALSHHGSYTGALASLPLLQRLQESLSSRPLSHQHMSVHQLQGRRQQGSQSRCCKSVFREGQPLTWPQPSASGREQRPPRHRSCPSTAAHHATHLRTSAYRWPPDQCIARTRAVGVTSSKHLWCLAAIAAHLEDKQGANHTHGDTHQHATPCMHRRRISSGKDGPQMAFMAMQKSLLYMQVRVARPCEIVTESLAPTNRSHDP